MSGSDIDADPLPALDALSAMLAARLGKPGDAPNREGTQTGVDAIDARASRERRISRKRDARRTVEEPKDQFQQIRCTKSWKALAKRVARRRGFASVSDMLVRMVIEAAERGD